MDTSNKLEYIASGTAYLKLNAPRNGEGENLAFLKEALASVKQNTDHKFGILYNAYTESRFGEPFQNYRGIVDSIHADSGGLQIITQGKKVTPDDKLKIFSNQGKYADYAMSFDENPVIMTSDRSERTTTSNRRFDLEHFEKAAKNTGKNIRDQIESFQEMKSDTKPIFIAQGNCYDTYMKWTELALKEIPQDMQGQIGSVALGASAIGYGFLEDIERAAYFRMLPIDCNHMHVLGVGSFRRLLPYLIFRTNGFYDENISISYDSTTHTSGSEMGHYFLKDRLMNVDRNYSDKYQTIYSDISSIFDMQDLDVKDFHKIMNTGYTKYIEELNLPSMDFHRTRTQYIMKSIINFCNYIDKMDHNKKELLQAATRHKLFKECYSLFGVKTKEDFDEWKESVIGHTKSKKISKHGGSSLESFF